MQTVFNRHEFEQPHRQLLFGVNAGGSTGIARPKARQPGQLYRLERGKPYFRAGKLVVATPQFKSLTLYSPVSTNSQVPPKSQQSTSIAYPTKTV